MNTATTISDEGPSVWFLKKDGLLLATLVEQARARQWVYCALEATSEFEACRHLFSIDLAAAVVSAADFHAAIRSAGISLTTSDGLPVNSFTVLVDGDQARLALSEVGSFA